MLLKHTGRGGSSWKRQRPCARFQKNLRPIKLSFASRQPYPWPTTLTGPVYGEARGELEKSEWFRPQQAK
jgi:hypothetical protein